jgi:cyclophilin family peptidyl-prolyl cis-trans isomerase/HEAT repeat protein
MNPRQPPPPGIAPWAVLALLLAWSCSASGSLATGGRSVRSSGPLPEGADVTLTTTPEFQEIRVLEDSHSLGDGRLLDLLLAGDDPTVRARAALALGRIPFPTFGNEVTGPLCTALEDADEDVRANAAFALAMRADPNSAGVLLAYWRDPSPRVRARIIDAASRVHTAPIRTQVVRSMRDPDVGVRQIAIRSTALWPTDVSDARDTDSALLGTLSRFPDASGRPTEPDPETVWCALYALARRKAEMGRGAFLEHATNADSRARLFAVQGLSQIEPSAEGTRVLVGALADKDWRVAAEAAVGLGASRDRSAVAALIDAVDHRVFHVRLRALEALKNFPADVAAILPQVWRGRQDLSGSVRATALGTLARLLDGAESAPVLEEAAADDDPVVRAGAAAAASAALESFRAIPLLERLARDNNLFVATAALEGFKRHVTPRARAILHEYLAHPDNGLRLSAVSALSFEANARESDVPALVQAMLTSTGDVSGEIAFNAARVLGKIVAAGASPSSTDAARRALVEMLDHDDEYVRRVVREVLQRDFGHPLDGAVVAASSPSPRAVPLPGRDFPAWSHNPVVEIATSRGSMTFELLPGEAPLHVDNFVRQAREGHYDGLTFHRVEPDFVIQGGDYRGDGNGAVASRGGSLRQEFSPRPFERGALGMPRNEDPDSGGSQFFVTHRDTPHLDGRYTLFGVLREGGIVLDAIEVGDVILGVAIGE